MWLFLVTATVHGLNGVYNALLNLGITGRARRAMGAILVLAGGLAIIQGTRVAIAITELI